MAKLQKYDLLELPWTDVAEYLKAGNDAVMIPVGSCEKHGITSLSESIPTQPWEVWKERR